MEQVLKIECSGKKYTVKLAKGEINPFRVYKHEWKVGQYGYLTERKYLVAKYANMASCLLLIAQDDVFTHDFVE